MTPKPPEPEPQAAPPPSGQEKKATQWQTVSIALCVTNDGAYRSIAATNRVNEIWLYEETPTKVIGWRQLPQDLPPST